MAAQPLPVAKHQFVHLHAHSEYSLLDGTVRFVDDSGKPSEFLRSVAQAGMPALAMTDHGNLYGAIEFYQACRAVGIKPIIGIEAYVAPGSRLDRGARSERDATRHLILLARDAEGYRNLMALSSAAFLEGFHYKPRIDKELLAKHAKGLVGLSGCLKSEVSQAVLDGNLGAAESLVSQYCDILGKENFFLEVMDHGLDKQRQVLSGVRELAKRMGLPLAATNDCHYFRKDDWEAHDARVCISTGALLEETKRLRFETHEFYYKSAEEMAKLFSWAPEALANTVRIAERCSLEIPLDQILLPHFDVPEGFTPDTYLERLCREGLGRLAKGGPEYETRLKYELGIIRKMGFSSYFLIVWDFIKYARSQGIPVGPGRGSGAGSLVANALDITRADPIQHGLLFERFLNPDRKSMPDLDIDFSDDGRERVIEYVRRKYGERNVAQIITFSSMNAKAVLRDVGRVMNMPIAEIDRIAKLVPGGPGQSLRAAESSVPELKEAQKEPRVKKLFELARKLEGLKRHTGVHAAGTVITKEPVVGYSPLARGSNEIVTTQYNDEALLKLGLLKVDFLGLRTLRVIDHAVRTIRQVKPGFDIEAVPFDDAKTFELLRSGHTLGVFQLDSSGMRDLLRKLKPTGFQDISAVLALYRPGPMESGMLDDFVSRKHGATKVRYDHPLLESVLKDTYGCMVYQEQVMEISKKLAGFTPGQADVLRKAMGKKIPEVMEEQRAGFVKGALANKVPEKMAAKIFEQMAKFGGYGFNRCVVGATRVWDSATGRPWTVRQLVESRRAIATWAMGEDAKVAAVPVARSWSNGVKPVFRLRTALGREIRATDNHPFFTLNGWRNLSELKAGERLAAPRRLPFGTRRWPKHQAALLGWVLSEGNTCHPTGFYVYSKDADQASDMARAATVFERSKVTVRVRRGLNEIYVGSTDGMGSQRRSGARLWLDSLGIVGEKATQKHVPPDVFELDESSLSIFLGRLWSGDGFVFGPGARVPFYATSSRRLARDVQDLLLRFGIVSRVIDKSFKYRGGIKPGYAVNLMGRESVQRFIEAIGPQLVGRRIALDGLRGYLAGAMADRMSKDTVPVEVRQVIQRAKSLAGVTWGEVEVRTGLSTREICSHVGLKKGFRRWTIARLADYFGSVELKRWAESDIYWDTVVSIEPDGEEETFDLEVPGVHNFIADGLFVHNSHTVAYAIVAYQTAYLKANFPLEFMAALVTTEIGHGPIGSEDKESKLVTYLDDAKAMGLEIVPPDVRRSGKAFDVERAEKGGRILYALLAVKNVGEGAVDSILEARRRGPFKSFEDFCRRVDLKAANRKVIESLIRAGAMDALAGGAPPLARARLLAAVEPALERNARLKEDMARGQGMLFGGGSDGDHEEALPETKPLSEHELLHDEKEVLGFFLSGHPLTRFARELETLSTHRIGDIPAGHEGGVRLAGILVSVRRMVTREKKEAYARAALEDLTGVIQVLVFPKSYQTLSRSLEPNRMVVVSGRLSTRGDPQAGGPELIAEEIQPLDAALGRWARSLIIAISTAGLEEAHLRELRGVLLKHPGTCPVVLQLKTPAHGVAALSTDSRVAITGGLFEDLEKTLGEKTWRIESVS